MNYEGLEHILGNSNGFSNILSGLGLDNEILKKCDDEEILDRLEQLGLEMVQVASELENVAL
jgi:hypothetical protein